MKKDFLQSLGLEEDIIQQIQNEFGKDVTVLKNTVTTLKDDLEQKDIIIKKRDERIAELEKIDVEQIKTQEYERGKTDGLAEVEKIKYDAAVNSELEKSGAKNVKALLGLLDMDQVKFENGTLTGLTEQIATIKEENGYLFEGEQKKPGFSSGVDGSGGNPAVTKEQFEKMGYLERLKLKSNDPEAYNQLTGKGE